MWKPSLLWRNKNEKKWVKHKKEKIVLEGDLPSPANPPSGCVFHTRCYKAQEICKTQVPELRDCGNGHCCACHFPENQPE